MGPIEAVHEEHIGDDQPDEDEDRALLGKPEAEGEAGAWNADAVQDIDEEDPRAERGGEPDAEEDEDETDVGAPVGIRGR